MIFIVCSVILVMWQHFVEGLYNIYCAQTQVDGEIVFPV